MAKSRNTPPKAPPPPPESYKHPEATSPLRPEVGTQAQFRKKKPPKTYSYDSSLSPAMDWDGQNAAREKGEALIKQIEEIGAELSLASEQEIPSIQLRLMEAVAHLRALSQPFLNWAGKAERLSFDVPTLPLFVHERLSTKAIIDTLKGHRKDKQTELDLFGDSGYSITDQILQAYEYQDKWVNRMILGDSLVVMNSLLEYEGLGGQVQMIYIDPPYGVKFGSNFQPFVRKRDVSHNDDDDMTREPEMVKAYRDTWEMGIHSYLTYLRDRLLLSRDLLSNSGSIFVQISDDNLHHVRELMDEIFGSENLLSVISVRKTTSEGSTFLGATTDFIIWYAKDTSRTTCSKLFIPRGDDAEDRYDQLLLSDGTTRAMTSDEKTGVASIPVGARMYRLDNITSSRPAGLGDLHDFTYEGISFTPGKGTFKTDFKGLSILAETGRLQVTGNGRSLSYRRFQNDFPFAQLGNLWNDISGAVQSRSDPKVYAVQTSTSVIERCLLLSTQPGDLVLDPTCGSGTTAVVAESWGRRWITIDTSRVPLALARQRLLTATYPFFELKDAKRGPLGGFVYERRQNPKGEEVGGIVPHVSLKSLANSEPPVEEVLVDNPEKDTRITRITGPFCFEATIPTPIDWEGDGEEDSGTGEQHGAFVDRMLEVLRRSPILHIGAGKTVALKNIRPPAKTLSLSAEALVDATAADQHATIMDAVIEADEANKGMLPLSQKAVAIVFGPENGSVSEKLVYEAAKEAAGKRYTHLYVIGFAVQPNARQLIDHADAAMGIPATYVQATPDLMMGDLLKNMRSSQIFSVCGLPDVRITQPEAKEKGDPATYQVELIGLDVFDPATMEVQHRKGADVPAWFLDTDYNENVFHVSQAFFPRTGAWESIKKALKATYDESVWDHLAGTTSAPFEAGEHKQIAVKVIDDRGNELLVVKKLETTK